MQADDETLEWIDAFTKKQIINKIPHHDYEIKIFDSPEGTGSGNTEKKQTVRRADCRVSLPIMTGIIRKAKSRRIHQKNTGK